MLLLQQMSLLRGISCVELVHYLALVVLELRWMLSGRLLALAAGHACSTRLGLLVLSLLREELGLEEVVGICTRKLVHKATGAVLHAERLVALDLVHLGLLQPHIGCLLLGLLL